MKKFSTREFDFVKSLTATSSALAIATSMALVQSAYAQDDVERIPESSEEVTEDDDTIVVTGSRIRKDEFTSTSPLQVLDPQLGISQGRFDTGALVQGSTLASGSSQLTSGISSNSASPQGGEGVQTVSLRGLGANRTLVLLNGRRAGPAGVRGQVAAFDLNVVPFSALETVEILKDGASSIYGSDAVAGVVNLITRKDFDGLELDGFYSQPLEGAGEFARASAHWGKTFDRGHFQVAVDYQKQYKITNGDREFLDCPEDYIFDANGNRADVVDPRGPGVHGFNYTGKDGYACANGIPWGHIWLYDYSYAYSPNGSNAITFNEQGDIDLDTQLLQYDYDGSLAANGIPAWAAPLDPSQIGLPPGFYPTGTNRQNYAIMQNYHVGERKDTFVPQSSNFTVFADAAYELTDNIEVYGDFLMSRRKTEQIGSNQFFNFGGTFDSPNLPGNFGIPNDPIVNPMITGDALISPTTYFDHDGQRTQVNYYRGVGGLRGELVTDGFLDSWRWDLYGHHSTSRGEYRKDIVSHVVSTFGDFRSAPCAGQSVENFAGVMTQCVDIDYNDPAILAGHLTPEQRNFLYGVDIGHTKYNQTYFEFIADGDVLTLPAGDVGVALGATWRKDSILDTPGDNTLGGFIFLENAGGITQGSSKTTELFGEINIPVLRDVPLFQSLEVNGSVRWTDVNTVAEPDLTWKAGVNWRVSDWLAFRGTWGTSFRAPALFELFLQNESFIVRQSGVDPCIQWAAALADGGISQRIADNCAADGIPDNFTGGGVEPTVTLGGGLGQLAPETSTSKVAGVILTTPSGFLGDDVNVSLAVDYFNIEVNGTVDTLTANQIVFGCYRSEFYPTDPLCDLFVRGQTGAPFNIDQISATFININRLQNAGLDITMQYTHEQLLGGWDLDVRSNWVHQLKDDEELFDGIVESVNGEAGDPKWVGEVNFIARKNDWTAFWGMNIVGPTSDEQDFLDDNGMLCLTSTTVGDYCVDLIAEATVYHNVSLTKELESWRFTLGMSNVFDTRPPRVTTDGFNSAEISTTGQMPFTSQYDVFGRRVFANISKSF